MKSLTVNVEKVESRSPVWVGRGLIRSIGSLLQSERFTKTVILGDSGAEGCARAIATALELQETSILIMQGGESCKTIQGLQSVWEFFVRQHLDRRSLVIAVGGGAMSDLVGFAAATFMRGIAYVPVPTTLLAQVDASIGGKSGINFFGAKNLLGAIKQPAGIVVDIDVLQTLSLRDLRSGFAEIVKHGLIADRGYFDVTTSRDCLAWNPEELVDIVFRSCEIKRDVVESDETEQGARKNLNFGHTLGHAIEALAIAEKLSITHGEAISIGMRAASFISYRHGLLSAEELSAILSGLQRVGLPIQLPSVMNADKLLDLIKLDKKNVGGKTRWSLLKGIGNAIFDQEVADIEVSEAIEAIQPRA